MPSWSSALAACARARVHTLALPHCAPFPAGLAEGAYAWLATNYLLGYLDAGVASKTVGTLEQGGASMQEAFALTPSQVASVPSSSRMRVKGEGVTYDVYAHSE